MPSFDQLPCGCTRGPIGPAGPQGPAGPKGDQGDPGPSTMFVTIIGSGKPDVDAFIAPFQNAVSTNPSGTQSALEFSPGSGGDFAMTFPYAGFVRDLFVTVNSSLTDATFYQVGIASGGGYILAASLGPVFPDAASNAAKVPVIGGNAGYTMKLRSDQRALGSPLFWSFVYEFTPPAP